MIKVCVFLIIQDVYICFSKFGSNALNQILARKISIMGIESSSEYVKFFLSLEMGNSVTLSSFVNNEKMVLKGKLENKNLDRNRIQKGIDILNELTKEINEIGEIKVVEKYGR